MNRCTHPLRLHAARQQRRRATQFALFARNLNCAPAPDPEEGTDIVDPAEPDTAGGATGQAAAHTGSAPAQYPL